MSLLCGHNMQLRKLLDLRNQMNEPLLLLHIRDMQHRKLSKSNFEPKCTAFYRELSCSPQ